MRRNPRGRRGGVIGGQSQRWHQNATALGGHLTPDRLDLQDIDKELELLQRKREIIEQQQQILSHEFRRNDYQEPYSQSSRFDEYAQAYGNARNHNTPSRKRPIPVWENDAVPSKRFSGPRPKTRPVLQDAPPPLMQARPFRGGYRSSFAHVPIQVPGSFMPKPLKRDSIPKSTAAQVASKSGPKPTATPLAPKPTASPSTPKPSKTRRAKSKITDAIDLTSDSATSDWTNRLCSDREPSNQVTGRLELALGIIIKDIKAHVDPNTVKSAAVIRDIKMTVRDRIRELMMDKVVGSAESIKARYREIYDQQSDFEVVANALDAQTGDVTLFNIDDAEKYFRVNMNRIMQWKLKNLLTKLEEMSHADTNDASVAKIDEPEEKKPDEKTDDKNPFDESITSTEKYKYLEKLVTAKMCGVIRKFLPFIVKLMDIDGNYNKLKKMVTSKTIKMIMQSEGQDVSGDLSGVDFSVDVPMLSVTSPGQSTPKPQRTPYKPLPYCVKLMGKPALPKRNHMEKFFEQFKPKSIKKHRSMHNLLFVGFNEKESFDAMLAADGTVIGKYTLSIRSGMRINPVPVAENKEDLDTSDDKLVLGAELDEQITDLLSSIRQSSEEGDSENANENAKIKNENSDSNAAQVAIVSIDDDEPQEIKSTEETMIIKGDIDIIKDVTEEGKNVTKDVKNVIEEGKTVTEEGNGVTEEGNGITNEENGTTNEGNGTTNEGNGIAREGNGITKEDNGITKEDNGITKEDNSITEEGNGITENKEIIKKELDLKKEDKVIEEEKDKGSADENNLKLEDEVIAKESADKVQALASDKPSSRSTPVRASTRLAATPGRIQTRRASRLAQNDADT